VRLFIATTFPRDVLADVNDRIARVKARLAAASWVRPEAQHLTFAFLGERPDALVDKLAPLVEERLADAKKFDARLSGSGFFPNPRHARVAWIGVTPPEAFQSIAVAVREAVKDAGIELDGADFKPHLTLCRIRDVWPPACIETFNAALRGYESAPFAVDHVTLFSSRLDPAGAVHTPLREMRLA
jgi:RNA 2',3'-cyclic 3'-phosphodiesterase